MLLNKGMKFNSNKEFSIVSLVQMVFGFIIINFVNQLP
jgi:hypothetical protein